MPKKASHSHWRACAFRTEPGISIGGLCMAHKASHSHRGACAFHRELVTCDIVFPDPKIGGGSLHPTPSPPGDPAPWWIH